eukprot:GHVN01105340.1.p1 GENE.GHVN01105340.1~~GHVN01105340.1.p1  ORF type:complete len:111 (+),score=7.28 GHVN01105340.1:54-386(+)
MPRDREQNRRSGEPPRSRTPDNATRRQAFGQAKEEQGLSRRENPIKQGHNVDRRGNRSPGRVYEFYKQDGSGNTITIRDDAAGHTYPDDPRQDRGPHFNNAQGDHYDYKR